MIRHAPVLAEQAVGALNVKPGGVYLDVTFGRGGHSRALSHHLSPDARLSAMDRDPAAVEYGLRHPPHGPHFEIVQARFSELGRIRRQLLADRLVDGILADLGVSSPQLGDPARGFAFNLDGPLDMRMDPDSGPSAREWIANADQSDLQWVIRTYGEERYAARIARAIVVQRGIAPITRTRELAELIVRRVPEREPGKHPATRTFQAIRIHINDELGQLRAMLPQAVQGLKNAGRLVVISFHSLEDRVVKRFMRDEARGDPFPSDLPVTADRLNPRLRLVGGPVKASEHEIRENRRARSAIMRVAERTGAAHA